jgi:protocatechuate 3,4-dioxygenase beta subunit
MTRRHRHAAVLAAALALTAALLPATAARAAGVGSLGGTVMSANSIPVGGVMVTLVDAATLADSGVTTQTDPYGSWQLDAIPEGTYLVGYSGPFEGYAPDLAPAESATQYLVSDGSADYVYDVISSYTIPPNTSLRAVGSDGTPLAICPRLYSADNIDDGPYGLEDCRTENGVTTGRATPGRWFVELMDDSGSYVTTWLGADGTRAGATPVTIPETGSVDLGVVTLPLAGSVKVRVLRADTGTPFGKDAVCVAAFVRRTTESATDIGCTDAQGYAVVPGLAAGKWSLQASPRSLGYVQRWSGSVRDQRDATLVSAVAGSTVTAPAIRLSPAGTITGIVRDKATGAPLAHYCAATGRYSTISGDDGTRSFSTSCSDDTGRYTIRGLDAGQYKIQWVAGYSDGPMVDHAVTWYRGTNHDNAEAVAVTNGAVTRTIDVALPLGGTITGRVLDAAGQPLAVDVLVAEAATRYDVSQTWSGSDGTGRYVARSIPTGRMVVKFWLPDGSYVYWDGTRDGTRDPARAVAVRTTAGAATSIAPIRLTLP